MYTRFVRDVVINIYILDLNKTDMADVADL